MHQWRIDEPQSSGPSLKSSRLPLGKDVYDPQGLPSKGHFTENWPSFGFAGYFRGKLAPFLGLSGILSGGAPPSNIQHDTPPSTIGGRQQQLSKHRKSAKLVVSNYPNRYLLCSNIIFNKIQTFLLQSKYKLWS